jgi:hypothetical protein
MMINANPLLTHTSLSSQVVSVKSFVNRSTSINGGDLAQTKLGKLNSFFFLIHLFVSFFACLLSEKKKI